LQGRSGRTTDTRGRNGASSHSSEGDASCDRSRGGHLAVFSDGRSLVSAVHVSSLGSGDARAATNPVIFVIKASRCCYVAVLLRSPRAVGKSHFHRKTTSRANPTFIGKPRHGRITG